MNTIDWIQDLINQRPTSACFQKIISALRGPDWILQNPYGSVICTTDQLKWFTTARLRAVVAPNYYGDVNRHPLTYSERATRDSWLLYAPKHFQSHYREAVEAVKIVYRYDLMKEEPCEQKIDMTVSSDTIHTYRDSSDRTGSDSNLR